MGEIVRFRKREQRLAVGGCLCGIACARTPGEECPLEAAIDGITESELLRILSLADRQADEWPSEDIRQAVYQLVLEDELLRKELLGAYA